MTGDFACAILTKKTVNPRVFRNIGNLSSLKDIIEEKEPYCLV